MNEMIFFAVSVSASLFGAICGIGGGVIMKPVLDMLHVESVAAVSFLCGCTVLAMSGYSVSRGFITRTSSVDKSTAVPLAIGAAIGGICGKQLFTTITNMLADKERVGAVQSAVLVFITTATFLYTLKKSDIKTHKISNAPACLLIGLLLGLMSSFLGIGGGPINLVVLFYFFSLDTKTAAQNSLFIILLSQFASLITTLITGSVPSFSMSAIVIMVTGGIFGGIAGQAVNKKIKACHVDKLFRGMMGIIIFISLNNLLSYL